MNSNQDQSSATEAASSMASSLSSDHLTNEPGSTLASEVSALESVIADNERAVALEAEAVTESVEEKAAPPDEKTAEDLSLLESLKLLFFASKAFWLVNIVNFGDGIAYFGILNLLTLFLGSDVGMNDKLAGISVSAFTGLVTLSMFGGGWFADKLGVRKALFISLLIVGIGRTALAFSPSLPGNVAVTACIAMVVIALAYGVLEPTLYAAVKKYTDPRTAAIGFGLLYSIMNLGIVCADFLSPFLRTDDVFRLGAWQVHGLHLGIQGIFIICGFITLGLFLILALFFTRKVEEASCYRGEESQTEAEEKKAPTKLPFTDWRFMLFIFMLLPVRTLFAHQFLTIPDYIFRCFPEAVSNRYEWVAGLNPLVIVLFTPLFAALTRKVKIINMMIIGTWVSALTTFILVLGPHPSYLYLYVILFSLGEALWASRFLEYVANLAPAGQVGVYMGLANLPWFLAKFTTGMYSGTMLEIFIPKGGLAHSETMWLIYGLIALITPVSLMLCRSWLDKDKKPAEAAQA